MTLIRDFRDTVILGIRSLDESLENFRQVWKTGKAEAAARIDFATPELLWKSSFLEALGNSQGHVRPGSDVDSRDRSARGPRRYSSP